MKRAILYTTISLGLITILLFRLDFFYVNVSPHNLYRLNETESLLIENAVSQFKERIETGKFDEIRKEIAENDRDVSTQKWIINDIKNDRAEFGKSLSWEIFSVAQPKPDKELRGKFYDIDYLTKTENGEVIESFRWVIKGNNEIKLFNSDIDELPDIHKRRLLEERDKLKLLVGKYPNEIIVPYADRYIEIRY